MPGDVADMIFVFFDPIGQALCKRTLSIVGKCISTNSMFLCMRIDSRLQNSPFVQGSNRASTKQTYTVRGERVSHNRLGMGRGVHGCVSLTLPRPHAGESFHTSEDHAQISESVLSNRGKLK